MYVFYDQDLCFSLLNLIKVIAMSFKNFIVLWFLKFFNIQFLLVVIYTVNGFVNFSVKCTILLMKVKHLTSNLTIY